MAHRTFRFGVVMPGAGSAAEWAAQVRRIESLGYATLVMPDTMTRTLSPIPALAAAAAATSTLRIGTYVLANDFRNPVLLAREAATLDFLSGGRLELGLGVGRPTAGDDYRKLGIGFDEGAVRVSRFAEALPIIKSLLAGERADAHGRHYSIAGADAFPSPVQQPRPPVLVAGSGRRLLALAGREADIIAIGARPDEDEAAVREKIGWVREGAGHRFPSLELNLNLFAVGQIMNSPWAARLGLDPERLARSGSPQVLLGTPDEMREQLLRRREGLGVSYFMVAADSVETLAPVVEQLAGR